MDDRFFLNILMFIVPYSGIARAHLWYVYYPWKRLANENKQNFK